MSYLNLLELSPKLRKIYNQYSLKLSTGYHLNSDLEDTVNIYRDVYGSSIINKSFTELIFHFHAITNSFDDIIDQTQLENRKNVSTDSIIIFSSFFIILQKIFYFFSESKETVISESIFNFFFTTLFENIKKICEAPLKELNPPKLSDDYPIEKIIIDIMYNRCYAYVFLGELCDLLLKIQKINLKSVTSLLVLYKIVEMINRDLNKNEIEKDCKYNTFNIFLHLQDQFNIKSINEITNVINSLLNTIKIEFNKELKKLELPEFCQLNQKLNEKIDTIKKKLENKLLNGQK